jgi:hypothetical protein
MIPVRRRPYDNLSGDLVEATILAHGRRERQAPDERLAKDLPGLGRGCPREYPASRRESREGLATGAG